MYYEEGSDHRLHLRARCTNAQCGVNCFFERGKPVVALRSAGLARATTGSHLGSAGITAATLLEIFLQLDRVTLNPDPGHRDEFVRVILPREFDIKRTNAECISVVLIHKRGLCCMSTRISVRGEFDSESFVKRRNDLINYLEGESVLRRLSKEVSVSLDESGLTDHISEVTRNDGPIERPNLVLVICARHVLDKDENEIAAEKAVQSNADEFLSLLTGELSHSKDAATHQLGENLSDKSDVSIHFTSHGLLWVGHLAYSSDDEAFAKREAEVVSVVEFLAVQRMTFHILHARLEEELVPRKSKGLLRRLRSMINPKGPSPRRTSELISRLQPLLQEYRSSDFLEKDPRRSMYERGEQVYRHERQYERINDDLESLKSSTELAFQDFSQTIQEYFTVLIIILSVFALGSYVYEISLNPNPSAIGCSVFLMATFLAAFLSIYYLVRRHAKASHVWR
jgi:hypothetical protein